MTVELIANELTGYVCTTGYRHQRHIRQVLPWLGFLLRAVEKLPGVKVDKRRVRQLAFVYRGTTFKARYGHKIGPRGGIEFTEVLPGRGAPTGEVILQITSLASAELAYLGGLHNALDIFVEGKMAA